MINSRTLHEELKELLEYNPATGEFFWRVSNSPGVKIGDIAGSVYANGYRYIQVEGLDYRVGRLAWYFVTGEDPLDFIDHKNGQRDDNRFENLRVATNSQNQANRGIPKNNTSGVKGVRWQSSRGKWIAMITIHGKAINLGCYDSIVDAAKAYRNAAIAAWGEFALVPSNDELETLAEEFGDGVKSINAEDLDL